MNAIAEFHQNYLKRELERRKAKNRKYSLRAFGRSLAVDPAT
jgi:hypothetical protein